MSNFKTITYSLLVIISFSLVSVSAQAGGVSFKIGGYGYVPYLAYNSHHPSVYSHYRSPVVIYRHYYQPYYASHHNSYYSGHHSGHRSAYRNNSHHHNSSYNRISRYNNGHDTHNSGHNSIAGTSSKKHRR